MEFTPTFRLRYIHDPDRKQGILHGNSGRYTVLFDSSNRLRAVVDPSSHRATNIYGTADVAGARVVIQGSETDSPRPGKSRLIANATSAPPVDGFAPRSATPPFSVIKPPGVGPMILNDQHVYEWLITKAWFQLEELQVPEGIRGEFAEDAVCVLTCNFLEKPDWNLKMGRAGPGFIKWLASTVRKCCHEVIRPEQRKRERDGTTTSIDDHGYERGNGAATDDWELNPALDRFRQVELEVDVRFVLQSMSDANREVMLRGWECLRGSHPIWVDLAERLGTCEKTAKARWLIASGNFSLYWKPRDLSSMDGCDA